jgi:hypothetical protein
VQAQRRAQAWRQALVLVLGLPWQLGARQQQARRLGEVQRPAREAAQLRGRQGRLPPRARLLLRVLGALLLRPRRQLLRVLAPLRQGRRAPPLLLLVLRLLLLPAALRRGLLVPPPHLLLLLLRVLPPLRQLGPPLPLLWAPPQLLVLLLLLRVPPLLLAPPARPSSRVQIQKVVRGCASTNCLCGGSGCCPLARRLGAVSGNPFHR